VIAEGPPPFRGHPEKIDHRIAELREAILRGVYVVDTRLLAERLIAAGVLLRAAKA